MGPVLGIDLGTVNSCVAVARDGKAEVLRDGGENVTPSCLALHGGKELVGKAALRHSVTEPQSTVAAVKRLLGHPYDSPEVQHARERAPYTIRRGQGANVLLEVGGQELTPVQVSARILTRIREIATEALGEPVNRAVISVPAHFNDAQRKATKLAAEYAGLEVVRLINEPTAAAFAYGYKRGEDFTLAVYDLGGGTFDITVLRSRGDRFEVLATDGDSYLGGEDFDFEIADWLKAEFQEEFGHDPSGDPPAMLRLKEAAQRAKVELSDCTTTAIELPMLTQLPDGSRPNFSRTLSRSKLDELVKDLVDRTLELVGRCLGEANVTTDEVDEVLLVGGQSRMWSVREAVRTHFGKEPRRDMNPDEVVAIGTALYAYSLTADELAHEATHAAGDAYEIARKSTDVARKLLDEVEGLESAVGGDNAGLRARVDRLLKLTAELEPRPRLEDPSAEPTPETDRGPVSTGPVEFDAEQLDSAAEVALDENAAVRGPLELEEEDDATPVSLAHRGTPADEAPPLTVSAFEPSAAPAPLTESPPIAKPSAGEPAPDEGVRKSPPTPPETREDPAVDDLPRRPAPPAPLPQQDLAGDLLQAAEPSDDLPQRPDPASDLPQRPDPLDALPGPVDPPPRAPLAAAPRAVPAAPHDEAEEPPDLPTRLPDENQLPLALGDLEVELEGLSARAQQVLERIAEDASGGPDEDDKEANALIEAASFITDKLDAAAGASQEARVQLGAAEEHANARKVELIDVTSHALGIAATLDLFSVLIPQNTPVPAELTRTFTTNQDGQQEVEIKAYQGRERHASENHLLGSFILEGLPSARRMEVRIDVTFGIDADGILRVSAHETETGQSQSIRVEDPLGLQQATPDEAVAAAEAAAGA